MFLLFTALPLSAQTASNELSTLVPPYGELPPTFWEQHQSAVIAAGFAFLAAAFLFLRAWLRPAAPVILPPEVRARQTLEKLQAQPEDGKVLSVVSQCLRRYVSEIFKLPNHEFTTAEFCAIIEGGPQIGAELAGAVSVFLCECDGRKFSPANPAAPIHAATRAMELVALAEKHRERTPAAT